jgi:hypothetical protein
MTEQNIIKCKSIDLIQRCIERKAKLDIVMQSVVHRDGDIWHVDVNHPSYPKPNGLGDRVEKVLQSIGITPERVSRLTGKPCNCTKRKKGLNDLGKRIGIK